MSHRCSCRAAIALLAVVLSSLALGVPAANSAVPPVQTPPASRGELLYAIHCIECHNAQIHWRDRRLARDWPTLEAQVDRWQRAARLGWSSGDIREVTRYLGDTVYRFPRQRRAVSSAGTAAD